MIIGKLIPAGTGFEHGRFAELDQEEEEIGLNEGEFDSDEEDVFMTSHESLIDNQADFDLLDEEAEEDLFEDDSDLEDLDEDEADEDMA